MEQFLTRVALAIAAFALAVVLIVLAMAFLGGALYLWLVSQAVAPPLAALIVGLAGLGCAAIIALVARLLSRRSQPSSAARQRSVSAADLAGELGEAAAREAVSLLQNHPYRALLISLAAGFAVGASPELRQILKDTLKR